VWIPPGAYCGAIGRFGSKAAFALRYFSSLPLVLWKHRTGTFESIFVTVS